MNHPPSKLFMASGVVDLDFDFDFALCCDFCVLLLKKATTIKRRRLCLIMNSNKKGINSNLNISRLLIPHVAT